MQALMHSKLKKVWEQRYNAPGFIKSLTWLFTVPKGKDNIWMVYNGSKSGLNDVLWAPWFPLLTVGTYMANLDIHEMFLNFILHELLGFFVV